MTREELQKLMDSPDRTAKSMRQIGEAYLRGDVLRDKIAAEGWLVLAVEQEDEEESPLAMALLAKEIYGAEYAVSQEDYEAMKEESGGGRAEKNRETKVLLQIAERERQRRDSRQGKDNGRRQKNGSH